MERKVIGVILRNRKIADWIREQTWVAFTLVDIKRKK